jgi:hypothetical protein
MHGQLRCIPDGSKKGHHDVRKKEPRVNMGRYESRYAGDLCAMLSLDVDRHLLVQHLPLHAWARGPKKRSDAGPISRSPMGGHLR